MQTRATRPKPKGPRHRGLMYLGPKGQTPKPNSIIPPMHFCGRVGDQKSLSRKIPDYLREKDGLPEYLKVGFLSLLSTSSESKKFDEPK